MVWQIVSGIILAIHFTATTAMAYKSLVAIIKEVYYGWLLYCVHSYGASFIFFFLYLHYFRGLYYSLFFYNPNVWITGCLLFVYLMAVGFLGYVIAWGEMSYWGATVITNLLTPIPNFLEWACGTVGSVGNATVKRFFIYHFILGIAIFAVIMIHFFYLHYYSSSNPYGFNTNNKVSLFPYCLMKDAYGLFVIFACLSVQLFWTIFTLTHPDNTFEASGMSTPLHIVPEWYFLLQYGVLKSIPNKNTGALVMALSIFVPFLLVEARKYNSVNGSIYNYKCVSMVIFVYFLVIGGKLPSDVCVSYGRLMSINYFFVFLLYLSLVIFIHCKKVNIQLKLLLELIWIWYLKKL